MNWFNLLIRALGGRKYFYATLWGVVASYMLHVGKIDQMVWAAIVGYTFSNAVIASNREKTNATKAAVAMAAQGAPNE